MSIQIILFGVVALVLVLDFALKGVKKKTTQDDVERIGEEQSKKKAFDFNYILARKRNILTFILLVILLKPLVHTFLFTEYLETTSSDKTYIGVNEPTLKLYRGLDRENMYLFDKDEDDYIIVDNKIFTENTTKLSSIFYGKNKWSSSKDFSEEYIKIARLYYNLINFFDDISYKGFNKDEYNQLRDQFFDGLIDFMEWREHPKYNIDLNLSKSLIEQWISEGKIKEPQPSLNYLIDYYNQNENIKNLVGFLLGNQNETTIQSLMLRRNKLLLVYAKSQSVNPVNIYTVNGERIYFEGVANDEQTYYPRTDEWSYNGNWDKKFYYYKKTEREASLNFHFQNIFKLKLWLFAVSFASLGVLVLLFNDKIKAR
jgi:hypothetical protein